MIYIILAVSILLTVTAQLLLAKGAVALGNVSFSWGNLLGLATKFFHNFYLLAGLFCFGLAFFLWVVVITKIKMSVAYPIATSLNLALVVLGSAIILKESLSGLQLLGVLLIIAGIFFVLWK